MKSTSRDARPNIFEFVWPSFFSILICSRKADSYRLAPRIFRVHIRWDSTRTDRSSRRTQVAFGESRDWFLQFCPTPRSGVSRQGRKGRARSPGGNCSMLGQAMPVHSGAGTVLQDVHSVSWALVQLGSRCGGLVVLADASN